MYLSAFRLTNYKSFADSGVLHFQPGFNVIVGQNNAGKTALVEGLSQHFTSHPHRSEATLPRITTELDPKSVSFALVELAEHELEEYLLDQVQPYVFRVAAPNEMNPSQVVLSVVNREIAFLLYVWRMTDETTSAVRGSFFAEEFGARPSAQNGQQFTYSNETNDFVHSGPSNSGTKPLLGDRLAERFARGVFTFRAERMNVGRGQYGPDITLASDASNLPTVLGNLQSNRERYRRYNAAVSTVFPEIKQVGVVHNTQGGSPSSIEIRVWTIDPVSEREDLSIPLTESGTGISQVLAILYVVLTAAYPQTIIIDEPQSFLHPGAARKLIEVLKQYPTHQYILTTHSAGVIVAAEPRTIHVLRKVSGKSEVATVDIDQADTLRMLLSEVGARLSDVFGADNILWVEGSTEEACIPLILRKFEGPPLYGTQILSVARTGDFTGRHVPLVFELYERLSTAGVLLPPALGFMFDREQRSEKELSDLQRRGKRRVTFTTRRMYENYLLHPTGIAAVAMAISGFRDEGDPLTAVEVAAWIAERKWDSKYLGRRVPANERSDQLWIRETDGARLLKDLFADLSHGRVLFDKIRHGVALTKWTLEYLPDELREFAQAVHRLQGDEAATAGSR